MRDVQDILRDLDHRKIVTRPDWLAWGLGKGSAVKLLEPGRKRRGKPTAFWLWLLVGAIAVLVFFLWVLR